MAKEKLNTKFTRVTMNLSESSMNNVEDLSNLIGESNRTRVITSSLIVAKAIISQVKAGKQIILRDAEGNEKEMSFIIT
jgi:hypothetical protein